MDHTKAPVKAILMCFMLLPVPLLHPQDNAASLKKQLEILQKSDQYLKDYHATLSTVKTQVIAIRLRAEEENINNFIKVYARGTEAIAGSALPPKGISDAYGLLDSLMNGLSNSPSLWDTTADVGKVHIEALKNDAAALKNGNRRLFMYCNELAVILHSDLPRFDDDSPSFPSTGQFWRKPDGKDDDETELMTRKLTVVRGFSGIIISAMDAELKSVLGQRKRIQEQLGAVSSALSNVPEAAPAESVPSNIPEAPPSYVDAAGDDRGDDGRDFHMDEPVMSEARKEAIEKAKAEREAAERLKQERQKKLEEAARVIIDKDCPTRLVTGEKGHYIAVIDPPITHTSTHIAWFVDDKQVSTTSNDTTSVMYATFSKDGPHEIRAVLRIRGKDQDQHLITVVVDKPRKPAKYDPSLEGKTVPAFDLGWCRYNTLFKGGKIYLTGYFYTAQNQKVEYTSLPIENYSPQAPGAGMVMTKTAGYHIYQTESDEPTSPVYVITRMRGAEVTILHKIEVAYFNVDIAKDYSRITVHYKADVKGNMQTIVLD